MSLGFFQGFFFGSGATLGQRFTNTVLHWGGMVLIAGLLRTGYVEIGEEERWFPEDGRDPVPAFVHYTIQNVKDAYSFLNRLNHELRDSPDSRVFLEYNENLNGFEIVGIGEEYKTSDLSYTTSISAQSFSDAFTPVVTELSMALPGDQQTAENTIA